MFKLQNGVGKLYIEAEFESTVVYPFRIDYYLAWFIDLASNSRVYGKCMP